MHAVTVREISEKAGVSPATVSRFLTGTQGVSAERMRRIQSVMSSLREDQVPRVRTVGHPLVGVLVPDLRLQFYIDTLREITEQIGNYPFQTVFIPECSSAKHSYLDTIKAMNLSGLILLDEGFRPELMRLIKAKDLRVVVCGGANLGFGERVTAVHINDLAGGYEGTRHLIRLGHRDIAFLGDLPRSISSGFQRIAGAKKALEEAGLDFHEELWRCGELTDDMGYRFASELLAGPRRFTALFAFSDQMAAGAMRALMDAGLRVPEDISVMGFDDLPIAEKMRPRLTTIHQSLKDIVHNTLDLFSVPDHAMWNTEIHVPFSVMERESCCAIASEVAAG